MSRSGDGLALGPDLGDAARAAVAAAIAPLRGAVPDLLALFVSTDDPAAAELALRAGHAAASARTSFGCSAAGVVGGGTAVVGEPAVSAWAAVLPGARVRSFHLEVMRTRDAWAVVGLPVLRDADDEVGLLLADPWSFPVEGFVGAAESWTAPVPVVGGVAHGARGPGSTRVMVDGVVHDRGAVGVVLRGVDAATVVGPGHRPFGPPMTVTGRVGCTLTELAGAPAAVRLAAARAALDEGDRVLAGHGVLLGVAAEEYVDEHGVDDLVAHAVVDVDEVHGSLDLAVPVEVGTTVRFCLLDPRAAATRLDDALLDLRSGPRGTGPATEGPGAAGRFDAALLVAGADRYLAAPGGLARDEAAVRRVLGAGSVAGMAGGGEVGPAPTGNRLRGLTATVLALRAPDVVRLPDAGHGAGATSADDAASTGAGAAPGLSGPLR